MGLSREKGSEVVGEGAFQLLLQVSLVRHGQAEMQWLSSHTFASRIEKASVLSALKLF